MPRPMPQPCQLGLTTTSHIVALKTPSDVARANPITWPTNTDVLWDFFVATTTQQISCECSRARRNRAGSRRGKPTEAKRSLSSSRSWSGRGPQRKATPSFSSKRASEVESVGNGSSRTARAQSEPDATPSSAPSGAVVDAGDASRRASLSSSGAGGSSPTVRAGFGGASPPVADARADAPRGSRDDERIAERQDLRGTRARSDPATPRALPRSKTGRSGARSLGATATPRAVHAIALAKRCVGDDAHQISAWNSLLYFVPRWQIRQSGHQQSTFPPRPPRSSRRGCGGDARRPRRRLAPRGMMRLGTRPRRRPMRGPPPLRRTGLRASSSPVRAAPLETNAQPSPRHRAPAHHDRLTPATDPTQAFSSSCISSGRTSLTTSSAPRASRTTRTSTGRSRCPSGSSPSACTSRGRTRASIA